jgi:hypothetical protein
MNNNQSSMRMNTMRTPTMKTGGVPDTPLLLFQPFNIIVWLTFFSPIILALSMVSMSFIFQNFKGFIYLGFLIGVCLLRNYVYLLTGSPPGINGGTICNSVQYTKYGNATFSAFVFSFTIMYLCLPMFSSGAPNFWIFSSLMVYFFLDLYIKFYKKCPIKLGDLFLNILLGLTSSALIIILMYSGGSAKYLFFNEVSSGKDVCYQPSKQTFKCQMYKDGTLIGDV